MTQHLLKQQNEINKVMVKCLTAKGGERTALSHTLGILVDKFDRALAKPVTASRPVDAKAPSLENFPADSAFLTDMDVIALSLTWRKTIGLNQADFWTIFGVCQSGGSRYENGRTIPKPTCMLMLSVARGMVRASDLAIMSQSGITEQ